MKIHGLTVNLNDAKLAGLAQIQTLLSVAGVSVPGSAAPIPAPMAAEGE